MSATEQTTPEDMAEAIALVLDGSMGMTLTQMKWGCEAMDGLPEFYVRNQAGSVFRFTCEAVAGDEFSPFDA